MVLLRLVVSMWEKVGVNARISVISDDEFMSLRKSGKIACYSATWSADFNDPDNFFYTFFGTPANTLERSLCYARPDIISRVRLARQISDSKQRIEEYRNLEEIIVQEDAAWIPLFSRLRYYVKGDRLEGMKVSWNGSVKNNYRLMSVNKE
jgi:ABC-type oligopeptide transport system substrate-binding subunit